MIALGASEARATSLTITVSESVGGAVVPIQDGSALDLNPAAGAILVNVDLLNGSLNNYQFTGLSANSNVLTASTSGSLSEGGTVQLQLGGVGSITVMSSEIDYNAPTGPDGTLSSSSSSTFTHTDSGNSQTFTSWFNPPVAAINDKDVPTPTVTNTSTARIPTASRRPPCPAPSHWPLLTD